MYTHFGTLFSNIYKSYLVDEHLHPLEFPRGTLLLRECKRVFKNVYHSTMSSPLVVYNKLQSCYSYAGSTVRVWPEDQGVSGWIPGPGHVPQLQVRFLALVRACGRGN